MDRAQATGFGISAAGHVALIAILSLGFAATRMTPPPPAPIEVSFVKDVGVTSAAPRPSNTPPAQSVAPEAGPPEEAAPAPVEAQRPPEPIAMPAPPRPVEPARPDTSRSAPKPAEKAGTAKPAPRKAAREAAHAPAKPAPAPAKPARAARAGAAIASRGSHLGADFLKGIGSDPTPSRSQQVQAASISAEALASIQAAILRQIQPCANRQVNPGPGANRIKVTLNLRLNRDGSLARVPRIIGTSGVSDENSRYEDRVKDLAVSAYVGCSPLHGLPDELYQTPKGGWSNVNMSYRLP